MDNEFEIIGVDYNEVVKGKPRIQCKNVKPEDLKDGIDSFLSNFKETISDCQTLLGEFELDEIELNLEITLTGGIRLIGTAEASTKGGLSLKLKRRRDA